MPNPRSVMACAALWGLMLGGCAGGGPAAMHFDTQVEPPPAPPPPPPPPPPLPKAPTASAFTSWSNATPPGPYRLDGAGVTYGALDWSSVQPPRWGPITSGDQTLVLSFTGAGDLADAYVAQGQTTIMTTEAPAGAYAAQHSRAFSLGSASLVMKDVVKGDSDTFPANFFVYADPASLGLNYLFFGWWLSGERYSTPDQYGSFSAGALTPGQSIPTGGSAQFAGALSAAGPGYPFVAAAVTINVDFAGRSALFNSGDFVDAQGAARTGTALSGVLTYSGGQNALTGQLTSSVFAGPANARFYGPGAEEIGGAFVLNSTDPANGTRLLGGFGAKR